MKLADRIRHLAETDDYKKLAEQWQRFEQTRRLSPGATATMVTTGLGLRATVRQLVQEHEIAHQYRADVSAGAIARAKEAVLPALLSFELFMEKGLRRPRNAEPGAQA